MKYKLAVIGAGILLGLIGVLVKLIGDNIPVLTLNFYRLFIGMLFVAAIIPFFDKETFKIKKKELVGHAIVGALMAAAFTLYMAAMLNAPVTNVALITALYVVIVPVFAYFILKEKFSFNLIIAISLALIGLVFMKPLVPKFFSGNILALTQAFVFAALIVWMRKEEKHPAIGHVFWFFLFATIFLTPTLFIYGFGNLLAVWPYVLLLGVLSTGLAYALFTYGLQGMDADTSAVLMLVVFPIASIVFAVIILKEVVSIPVYIGGALILVAGLITVIGVGIKKQYLAH